MNQWFHKRTVLIGTVAILSLSTVSILRYHESGLLRLSKQTEFVQEIDLSDYPTNEVFVRYVDGTQTVLSFDTKKQLEEGIKTLKEDSSVQAFQPNYTYVTTGVTVSDTNFSEQWALYNNGTFSTSDAAEEFPIYSDPFKDPINDFWNDFMDFFDYFADDGYYSRRSLNQSYSSNNLWMTTTATKGIDINIKKAWKKYDGGTRDTIVAIIDTGVDYTHEDLIDSIWINEDEIPEDGVDNDGNGYIDDVYGWNFYHKNNNVYVGSEDSHGTHGAGTIAATRDNGVGVAGIAGNSKVKIMIIKALGGSAGYGTTESIVKAIKYAEDNGAVICNLSFGTNVDDTALKDAIADSTMLFIAAAGNGDDWTGVGKNDDVKPIYPAAYHLDQIISVANLNYDGMLHYSSNYGASSVDLAAPGSYILSTTPENTYSYMSGTSMAAPMVTGVAAMIYSEYSDVTLHQVKDMILNSVKQMDSLKNEVSTGGMLDAAAAFSYDYSQLATTPKEKNDKNSEDMKITGVAPEISAEMSYLRYSGQKVLTLTVTDADEDLAGVYYGKGKLKLGDFKDVSQYEIVNLNANNQAMFRVVSSGTYTFYAIDRDGNASIYTVTVRR